MTPCTAAFGRWAANRGLVLLLASGLALSAPALALGQVPDWVTGEEEVALQYETMSGFPMNLLLMFVSTRPSQVARADGEYPDPWTRVYALKDYYDMARLLEVYPEVKCSISLSPALLEEIEGMVEGYDRWQESGRPSGGVMRGCDRWLRLSLTPLDKMTYEDRLFVAANFFRIPGRGIEQYHGGLARLWEVRGTEENPDPADVLERLGNDGLRDLIAWFNLAVFDPDFLAGRITLPAGEEVDLLPYAQRVKGFSREDISRIIDAQFKVLRSLVPLYRKLQEEGRLEVLTAPFFDPVLPLLFDPELARPSSPGVTLPQGSSALADDAGGQLELAQEQYRRLFGRPAKGIWLGSGAAERELVPSLLRHGFAWAVADHEALRATTLPARPRIGERKRYALYEVTVEEGSLSVFFQDPEIIRDFLDIYPSRPWLKAANIFIVRLRQQQAKLHEWAGRMIFPVVLPLEAYWEKFDNDGKDFLHSVFHQIEQSVWINMVTPSSYLAGDPESQPVDRLAASVPANRVYTRWVGGEGQNAAWRELARAREALEDVRRRDALDPGRLNLAARLIYRAEGRDILAGYGEGGDAARTSDFLLRELLRRAYQALDREIPADLSQPLGPRAGAAESP